MRVKASQGPTCDMPDQIWRSPPNKAFLPHQRVTTEGKGMDEKVEFPSGFSNLMYALTKEAARNSFLDFLEEWGIEDYDEIKAFLAKNGVKTYC